MFFVSHTFIYSSLCFCLVLLSLCFIFTEREGWWGPEEVRILPWLNERLKTGMKVVRCTYQGNSKTADCDALWKNWNMMVEVGGSPAKPKSRDSLSSLSEAAESPQKPAEVEESPGAAAASPSSRSPATPGCIMPPLPSKRKHTVTAFCTMEVMTLAQDANIDELRNVTEDAISLINDV